MRATSLAAFLCVVRAVQVPLSTDQAATILDAHTNDFINGILREWNSPGGLGVATVKKDGHVWHVETKGYGKAQMDGTPVSPDSRFCIASNSKVFDVFATGLLISNESLSPRITWDTKLKSIVPDWEVADSVTTEQATITDAMSHRTGLPGHDNMYDRNDTVSSILKRLKYLRPSMGFRETYQYNNCMYTMLTALPPLLTGVSYAEYVQKNIFERLGLDSTTYMYEDARDSMNLADGFGRQDINKTENLFGKGTPRRLKYPNKDVPQGPEGNFKDGAGGVIMSVKDAATWLQVLLLEGRNPVTNESVIPVEVIRKAALGVTVAEGEASYPEMSPVVYGGGQMRSTYRGHEMIEHGGSTVGYMTQITRFPLDNFGVAVFSNDDVYGAFIQDVVKFHLIDKILGLDGIDWNRRLKEQVIANHEKNNAARHVRPSDPKPPSISPKELVGPYTNLGYGQIEFCLVDPEEADSCGTSILPGAIKKDVPTLIAKWDKYWISHFKLEHFDGNVWNVTLLDSRTVYEPEDEADYWVQIRAYAEAEFADGGFGIRGGFWGWGFNPGTPEPEGETVKERAEVWFDRA